MHIYAEIHDTGCALEPFSDIIVRRSVFCLTVWTLICSDEPQLMVEMSRPTATSIVNVNNKFLLLTGWSRQDLGQHNAHVASHSEYCQNGALLKVV